MAIVISSNTIKGSLQVGAETESDNFYNIALTNSVIKGNIIFKTKEITKNWTINECNIDSDLEHVSPEVWFMYRNIIDNKKNITQILNNYALGRVDGLRFNLPFKPSPLMSECAIGVITRCLEFLKKYHNPIKLTWWNRLIRSIKRLYPRGLFRRRRWKIEKCHGI